MTCLFCLQIETRVICFPALSHDTRRPAAPLITSNSFISCFSSNIQLNNCVTYFPSRTKTLLLTASAVAALCVSPICLWNTKMSSCQLLVNQITQSFTVLVHCILFLDWLQKQITYMGCLHFFVSLCSQLCLFGTHCSSICRLLTQASEFCVKAGSPGIRNSYCG